MALAFLTYRGPSDGNLMFEADIGTNDFFQVNVGRTIRRHGGLQILDDLRFTSPILRLRKDNELYGTKFMLPVPDAAFADRSRYIQLWSYKTPERTGPALSRVVAVGGSVANALPEPARSLSEPDCPPMTHYPVRSQASYRESNLSTGMFWTQLLGMLPGIVDAAAPSLRGLLSAGGGGGGGGGGTSSSTPQSGQNLVQAVVRLLQGMTQPAQAGTPPAAAPPAAPPGTNGGVDGSRAVTQLSTFGTAKLPPSLARMASHCVSRDTLELLHDSPRQMGMVLNDSILRLGGRPRVAYPYAEAQMAIAPIIAAIAPYAKDILELGNKADAEHQRHLERLVELLNDPTLTALMATLSTPNERRTFIPEPRVQIDTEALPRVELRERERVVMRHGVNLRVPFRLISDRPSAPTRAIPRVVVQATLQDSETMAVLWEREFRVKDVKLGDELRVVEIPASEAANLPRNVDLKLELVARWPSPRGGQVYGTLKNQFVMLVSEIAFDRLGKKVGETQPLNDVVRHRSYWHRVWEGGYAESRRWHVDFELKYFLAVDPNATQPAHLETRVMMLEDNMQGSPEPPSRRKLRARMKAGMELTIEMLADLLPALGQTAPSGVEREALRDPQLCQALSQLARTHVDFKGRGGETATLWVYPEMDVHEVHLLRVDQTNEDGYVVGMSPSTILFPRPSSLHFIGARSE